VANSEARPKRWEDVATIGQGERPTADLTNPPSAERTITDKARRQRTSTQHGLHPTGAGAIASAGG
jgi:hypothetical protein